MKIVAKFFNSNEKTYTRFYKDAVYKAFLLNGIIINIDEIELEIIYLEGDTIQAQRSPSSSYCRAISVYVDNILKYIIGISNTGYDIDKIEEGTSKLGNKDYHSNTYLCQGINKIFDFYFTEKKKNKDIKLYFYLLDSDKESYPNNFSNTLNYRKLYTLGFQILNLENIKFESFLDVSTNDIIVGNLGYNSFNKFINDLSKASNKNGGNRPSYLKCIDPSFYINKEEENNNIDNIRYIFTFKTLGAGAYDSFLTMRTLYELAKREQKHLEFLFSKEKYNFRLGQEKVKFTTDFPNSIKTLFKTMGINIKYESGNEALQNYEREESQYQDAKKSNILRNQELFKNNMREKGVMMKCCLCGCEIENILEAAHLWGVSEINKTDSKIIDEIFNNKSFSNMIDKTNPDHNTIFYKKYLLANSGDNGVWLCSNHHGLFDSGFYGFEPSNGKIIGNNISNRFFKEITTEDQLPQDILTEKTKIFLYNHFNIK